MRALTSSRAGRTGLWLLPALGAASALFVAWKVRQAEKQNPPRGRFIEVEGVRLHYLDRGLGVPVVLLHGQGSMSEDFELSGLIDRVAREHRVIAFDRPGYGYSERPYGRVWTPMAQARLIRSALGRMGVQKPVLVGHSWGALVAASYALQFPADLRSLVLISGCFFPTLRLDTALFSPPALPLLGTLLRFTLSPLLGRLAWPLMTRLLFSPGPVAPRFRRFPTWLALRPRALRAAAAESALLAPAAFALQSRYRDVAVPTFIVAGERDRYVNTDRHSGRLHREIRGSRMRITPAAGHMIHHVAPEEVAAAIGAACAEK